VQRGRTSSAALGLPQGTPVAPGTLVQAKLSASYEVDLFGRVSSAVSAARADVTGSEATYRSVLLALQADVAQTYFQLRGTDAEIALLREIVQSREESVRIYRRRVELGDIGELDLERAQTVLSNTRADVIAAERLRGWLEHALAVLLGRVRDRSGPSSIRCRTRWRCP
jgi:outer membrane protein, multidrug efflux system